MSVVSFALLTFILPIPIAHLWLHALLSWWRKYPFGFYLFCIALWSGNLILALYVKNLFPNSPFLFNKTYPTIGIALIAIGLFLVMGSIFSLGIKRFFLWSVLNPRSNPFLKKPKLFEYFPHPAYLGYLLITIGNFIILGTTIALMGLISFLVLIPIVIFIEEEELKKRTA